MPVKTALATMIWQPWMTALLFLCGCSGGNIVLDNPRENAVIFAFDGNSQFELGAGKMETVKLEPGDHRVSIKSADGAILADTTFRLREAGLVHSGAGTYLVWRQLYGLQKDRATLLNERWVEFDSVRAYGDIKVYEPQWVFIEKSWDKGLDEELPDSKNLYITKDFALESKVFRAKEFVKTYKGLSKQQ